VLAFNQRAERLREFVKRGLAVNVVGYLHSREVRSREGAPRELQEIYAVSVTPPKAR
jgi:single-stranded DNA-binding protein